MTLQSRWPGEDEDYPEGEDLGAELLNDEFALVGATDALLYAIGAYIGDVGRAPIGPPHD